MNVLGLDIGGANIKAVDTAGNCLSVEFALWRAPSQLRDQLKDVVSHFSDVDAVALTMTGELADCFRTKCEGVEFIVDACSDLDADVLVYTTNGSFVSPGSAKSDYQVVAAANWHALATFSCRFARTPASVLVDIGSTTTDVIPVVDGRVIAMGVDDYSRLKNHELVYTGVERSSVSGLTNSLVHRGSECPLMNELFATTLDAYVVLEEIEESDDARATADGTARTIAGAINRLARLIGKDETSFKKPDAIEFAEQIRTKQLLQINSAINQVARRVQSQPWTLIISGQGEFLVSSWNGLDGELQPPRQCVSLTDALGPNLSTCAPALAVAQLLAESFESDNKSSTLTNTIS